jgi:D-sedoheptulose 7-phosphate isomerase
MLPRVAALHPVITGTAKEDLDLIVYDFDGVMTDNRVYVMQDGRETVMCNRADGLAVDMLRAAGIPQLILSTETNAVVQTRAQKLGLGVINACTDKARALSDYCDEHGYDLSRVLYVGNDVNDIAAMHLAGYAVSPADGHPAVRAIAHRVTNAVGGAGVLRELADWLLVPVPASTSRAEKDDMQMLQQIRDELNESVRLREALASDEKLLGRLCALAETIANALRAGNKIIFAGNGGSYADAQHLAAEFVGRFMRERAPLAAVCLGTNGSTITAVGNDYRFEEIFARELRAVGTKGDVFIPISTSGNSGNLIQAIEAARQIGMEVYALLGKGGGRMTTLAPSFVVPSSHTARIQEIHITLGHIVCGLVDDLLDAASTNTNGKA